jgi:hypothetical protein
MCSLPMNANDTALAIAHASSRAETLAWEHGLQGYDPVQLASGVFFQESPGTAVRLATFDRQLWNAAQGAGFQPWPEKAPQ